MVAVTGRWTGGGQRWTWLLATGESAVKETAMSAAWAGTTSPGVCTALTPNSPLCTTTRAQILQLLLHPESASTWIILQEHSHFTVFLMACSFCTESRRYSLSPSTLHSVCGASVVVSECRRVAIVLVMCDKCTQNSIYPLKK